MILDNALFYFALGAFLGGLLVLVVAASITTFDRLTEAARRQEIEIGEDASVYPVRYPFRIVESGYDVCREASKQRARVISKVIHK